MHERMVAADCYQSWLLFMLASQPRLLLHTQMQEEYDILEEEGLLLHPGAPNWPQSLRAAGTAPLHAASEAPLQAASAAPAAPEQGGEEEADGGDDAEGEAYEDAGDDGFGDDDSDEYAFFS